MEMLEKSVIQLRGAASRRAGAYRTSRVWLGGLVEAPPRFSSAVVLPAGP